MKIRYADLKDGESKDVSFLIPEPLHDRLAKHQEISGEQVEEVVIKALDEFFESRVRLEEIFEEE